jgi:hypothetical protein
VHATVAALRANTTYFYRLDITLAGVTRSGSVQSFKTRAPAPSAKTGSAQAHGVGAAISGKVDPNGFATRYHFELGTKKGHYTKSSASAPAGSGRSRKTVNATLTGLRPHTTYHYRLLATNAGGTATGADRTFKTGARPPHPPRFSFKLKQTALRAALAHGLRATISCSSACQATATAFPALPGIARAASLPVTIATGTTRLQHNSTAIITLHFTPAAKRHLRTAKTITLIVTASAANHGSQTTTNLQTATLRQR